MSEQELNILNEIKEDVKKIFKILLGNGEKGLCEKVRDIEDTINTQKKNKDVFGQWIIRIVGILLAVGELLIAWRMIK